MGIIEINNLKFTRDYNFKELSPKDGEFKYRYETLRPLIIPFTKKNNKYISHGTKICFYDKNGREWLYMDHSHFIIHNHYAWDACTPKKHIPIFGWVGTPDFEQTLLASLIHDVFCQFQDTEHFPFSRYVIDNIFRFVLEYENFEFVDFYYAGVRVGSLSHKINKTVYSKIIT